MEKEEIKKDGSTTKTKQVDKKSAVTGVKKSDAKPRSQMRGRKKRPNIRKRPDREYEQKIIDITIRKRIVICPNYAENSYRIDCTPVKLNRFSLHPYIWFHKNVRFCMFTKDFHFHTKQTEKIKQKNLANSLTAKI